jgi:hypothetical protein
MKPLKAYRVKVRTATIDTMVVHAEDEDDARTMGEALAGRFIDRDVPEPEVIEVKEET